MIGVAGVARASAPPTSSIDSSSSTEMLAVAPIAVDVPPAVEKGSRLVALRDQLEAKDAQGGGEGGESYIEVDAATSGVNGSVVEPVPATAPATDNAEVVEVGNDVDDDGDDDMRQHFMASGNFGEGKPKTPTDVLSYYSTPEYPSLTCGLGQFFRDFSFHLFPEGPIVLALTYFSTTFSGYTVVGVPAETAAKGWGVGTWYGLLVIATISNLTFTPRIRCIGTRRKYVSPSDLIGDRFNSEMYVIVHPHLMVMQRGAL